MYYAKQLRASCGRGPFRIFGIIGYDVIFHGGSSSFSVSGSYQSDGSMTQTQKLWPRESCSRTFSEQNY